MVEQRQSPFTEEDQVFLAQLEGQLQELEATQCSAETMRTKALEYYCRWGIEINNLI